MKNRIRKSIKITFSSFMIINLIVCSTINMRAYEDLDKTSKVTENLIKNWSFEESEKSPSSPNGPSGTWWNTDLWTDDQKAVSWDFQRWNIDQPNENFNAQLDTAEKVSGNHSVKVSVSKSNSNTQAFLKQNEIEVKGNTYYDLNYFSKLDNISGSTVVARIEEYSASNSKLQTTNFDIGNGSSDWKENNESFKTQTNTTKINLIFVVPSSTTGSLWLDDVSLKEKDLTLTNITLDNHKVVLSKGDDFGLKANLTPTVTQDTELLWTSLDSTVATVDQSGKVVAVSKGETIIQVTSSKQTNIKDECIVKVVEGDIIVDELKIVGGDFGLDNGKKRFVQFVALPATAINTDLAVKWTSSDESILSVEKDTGLVEALKEGKVTLTVESVNDVSIKDTCQVTVSKNKTDKDYILMKERWLKRIVGDETLDTSNQYVSDYIDQVSLDAEELWKTLNKEENRTYLWELKDGDTISADYTTQFNNILKLTKAFGTSGSTLEGNLELYQDIIDALDFMTITKKYNGTYSTGNWWDWQIGCAQPFTDILMILEPYMSTKEIDTYAQCIAGYASDPSKQWGGSTATGANRTDIGISVLGTAILLEDDDKMDLVVEKIPAVFKLVTSGDGLYKDGSVVQHTYFAYSGSYGNELMKGIGRILSTTADTKWEFSDDTVNNVYNTVKNGYLPLVHNGRMMSMMSGRSISRAPGTNKFASEFSAGQETIANIMVISQFAPKEYSDEFRKNVKYWIQSTDKDYNFYKNARDIEALQNAIDIMNNDKIEAKATSKGVNVYSMDRAVQQTEDYAVGISMYSSRIANYEYGNNENAKGWHQGDGVLSIYNNDNQSFGDGYWATVDSYRLPGTTIDTKELSNGEKSSTRSSQKWVGGSAYGDIGAVGMSLDKSNTNMDLTAKKSWFLLDGKVVALGSDIQGTTDSSIETIIENRMIKSDLSNEILINGQDIKKKSKEYSLDANSWAHLEGNSKGADIGYYFPSALTVETSKETNIASYKDINTLFVNNEEYTNSYYKMIINHGKTVSDASYEYVLLPGKTADETKQYAEQNSLEIIANNDKVHAIKDGDSNMFAMNVWDSDGQALNGYSVNKASSMIVTQQGDKLTITISDPMRQSTDIEFSFENEYLEVLSMDDQIQTTADKQTFVFDSRNTVGGSSQIVLRVKEIVNSDELVKALDTAKGIDQEQYTKESCKALNNAIKNAENILKDENATQKDIDEAVKLLNKAIDELVPLANKVVLKATIEIAKSINKDDYTNSSYKKLTDALTIAEKVYKDREVSQDEVNLSVKNLLEAINSLVEVLDKSELEDLITQAETIDNSLYTQESYKRLTDAIQSAKKVVKNEEATAQEIEETITLLEEAIKNLQKIQTDNEKNPEDENDKDIEEEVLGESVDKETQENSVTQTFDDTHVMIYITIILVTSCLFIYKKSRTHKKVK